VPNALHGGDRSVAAQRLEPWDDAIAASAVRTRCCSSSHHRQQLEPAREHPAVRHLGGADAANVLVHDLLAALQAMDRQQVARRYGSGGDLVAADTVGLQRLIDLALEVAVLLLAYLGPVAVPFHHVFHRRLAGEAAFREIRRTHDRA